MVSVIVAIVVGTTILLLIAKKAWNIWTSQFIRPSAQPTTSPNSHSHHDDERPERHGMANMEDVREQEQALLSRPLHTPPQIWTNPLPKRLAAIRDENIQGQLQLHQAQSLQQRLMPSPQLGYTMTYTMRPAGAPVDRRNIVSEGILSEI